MKILVLGAAGQVGHELVGPLRAFADVVAVTRMDADLSAAGVIDAIIQREAPTVVVNAASYNDVDRAESEPEVAMRVNADAVAYLGRLCAERGIGLVHYSTDFVFDGSKDTAYLEDDEPNPLGAYARSKLAGEQALAGLPAIVLRTAWVFGLRRKSFVSTILRAARREPVLRVVGDQVGSPTFCRDLAIGTALILFQMRHDPWTGFTEAAGVYHMTNQGSCSRHQLATAAIELDPRRHEHVVRSIEPVTTAEYPLAAQRPPSTPLDCTKVRERFGIALPPWRDAVARALADSVWFV